MALVLVSEEQRNRLSPEQFNEIQHNNWILRTRLGSSGGDCIVTYEGKQLRLHKDIICKRSGFFRGAFMHAFMESAEGVVHLREHVSRGYLSMILVFIYLSIPEAGFSLDVYPPMSDGDFYQLMFELYRQAWYLKVPSLTWAILAELQKRLAESVLTVFRLQHRPADPVFVKAYEDTMKAVVYAYDNSNKYHEAYWPFRNELFLWVGVCYPVLSRVCDDFYEYLDHAPMLAVTILKMNHNITTSHFILPGPEARCMFCNRRVGYDKASLADYAQPRFGVMADRSGGVKYFCGCSPCFGKIRVRTCFLGTHTCVGPVCDCGGSLL